MKKLYLVILLLLNNNLLAQKFDKLIEICIISDSIPKSTFFILSQNQKILKKSNIETLCFPLSISRSGLQSLTFLNSEKQIIKTINFNSDSLTSFNRWKVLLSNTNRILDEVIVKAGSRYINRGDTLIIKTDGIETRPHANADELLENIPGIRISSMGSITVLGKRVDEVLVDGKKIFGGNSKATIENLKSEMVEQLELQNFNNPNSENINVLNIKLKFNRKRGIYGEVGMNGGNDERYNLKGKVNNFNTQNFFNGFSSTNNVNELILTENDMKTISQKSFLRNLKTPTSIVKTMASPYEDNSENSGSMENKPKGLNKYFSSGISGNYFAKRWDIGGYFLADYRDNFLSKNMDRRLLTKETFIQNNSKSLSNSDEKKYISNIELNYKPDRFNTIFLTNSFLRENNKVFQTNDNVISLPDNVTNSSIFKTSNLTDSKFNNFQFAWVKKYKKNGVLTSFQFKNNLEFDNIMIKNESLNTLITIQDKSINYSNFEFIQSYPITKLFLIEGRANIAFDNSTLSQTTNKDLNRLSTQSGIFASNNLQQLYSCVILYQKKVFKFSFGGSFWKWNNEINGDGDVTKKNDNNINPLLGLEYRINPKSSITFKTGVSNWIPSFKQLNSIGDSTLLQFYKVGNQFLLNNNLKYLKFTYDMDVGKGVHLDIGVDIKSKINPVLNESNYFSNGIINESFYQNGQTLNEFTINSSLIKVNFNSPFFWFLLGVYSNIENVSRINQVDYKTTSQFVNILNTFDYKTEKIKYSLTVQNGLFKVPNIPTTFQNNLKTKVNYKINSKKYFELIGDYTLNINSTSNSSFFIFNANYDQYLFKSQKIRVGLKVNNLFNIEKIQSVNQQANELSTQSLNYLGRVFLFTFSFYPSKWY